MLLNAMKNIDSTGSKELDQLINKVKEVLPQELTQKTESPGGPLQTAAKHAPTKESTSDNPPTPKAFYNEIDRECYWEKIIDPSTGRVSCAVPRRHGANTP